MATVLWSTKSASAGSNTSLSSGSLTDQKDGAIVVTRSTPAPLADTSVVYKTVWWGKGPKVDPDSIATQPSVYDDPDAGQLYQPRSDYENLHRFDPNARWTWREEWALVRKIDFRIMLFACIAFMSLELDRANIGQAATDNFLKDLKMNTNDYNLGFTIFRLSFLFAELPSQLVSKWIGPDRWIPAQMVLWSVVAASQFALSDRTSFLVCRSLLGILQGGFIPDMVLYLSYFYTSAELPIRLAAFWAAMSIADILASFLAFGILHMRGVHGHEGWRWLFLLEGILTGIIGLLAFVLMPASPTQTASWFRGKKGWFNEREETIIVTRALRDDPSKGSMHNRQPITPKLLWKSMKDWHMWPLYLLGLVFQLPMIPPNQYLTLSLRGLGFDTFQTNLLVIPSVVGHIITQVGMTYLSERLKSLTAVAVLGQFWALPFLIALYKLDVTTVNKWIMYAIITTLLTYPNAHAIQVAWNSRNSNTVRSRTVSAAMYNMFVQSGAVIASNIYREDDKPRYRRGNSVLLSLACVNIVIYAGVWSFYRWINRKRDREWEALTAEQKEEYVRTTKDEGTQRLDFRFAY